MDPMTMAFLGTTALQMFSGLQQADMMRDQAALNQRIADQNAKYAEFDAWEAETFGYTQSARYQAVIDQTVGQQKTAFASQDVDISSGTAKAVIEESKLAGFLNTLDIQEQARNKAFGLKIEASNIRLGGQLQSSEARLAAGATERQAVFGGISSGISGYAQLSK